MMNCSMPTLSSLLFFIFFLSIPSFTVSFSVGNNAVFCPEIEKQSLLSFKHSLKDPYKLLSSWNSEVNCCKWNRVICSNFTGHVHQLHLRGNYHVTPLGDDFFKLESQGLSGKINPSLLNLKHLTYLDLSANLFEGETIPSFMGSLSNLEHLYLSDAGFEGKIPHTIGNLSHLHTLHLGLSKLEVDSLEWLSGLSQLEYLNMDWTNLSRATDWAQVINSLPSLLELHLSRCSLDFSHPPSTVNLSTSLTLLDLSFSRSATTPVPVPLWCFQLRNLLFLDVSGNNFGKLIPTICNATKIKHIDLSGNHGLEVDSLEWLSGHSKLEYLNMDQANLSRAIDWAKVINSLPSLLELHLSECSLDFSHHPNTFNLSTSLTFLDLSEKSYFSRSSTVPVPVPVPVWFFQLRNLLFLDLSCNHFGGPIPTTSNATKIKHISLIDNDFSNSSIPDWLYECTNLEFISLRSNSLQGKISGAIANLTSLKTLNLEENHLSGKIPREITSLCRIQSLVLSYNQLEGEARDIFGNMSGCFLGSLEDLWLSNNQLSGNLTEQFGEFKILEYLDLRSNSLLGSIPTSLGNLSSLKGLYLSNNKFTRNLPESFGKLYNLAALRVESNKLEGTVTEIHFANLSKLATFFASGNHLTLSVSPNWVPPIQLKDLALESWSFGADSEIPSWLRTQRNITQLDLSNTGISGTIPSWFLDTWYLNVSHNNLHGKIPNIIGSKRYVQYLYLSYNKLSGALPLIGASVLELDLSHNLFSEGISDFVCNTTNEENQLRILLLEGNQLSEKLPDCWNKWPSLIFLKLGNNTMSGCIPNSIGFLAELETLSLRSNKFSGQIPLTMHNCTKLWNIDLSHNNLDGKLPTWIGRSLVNLKILILQSNKLSGEISSEICRLQALQILHLSDNQFSGIIPRCVSNFTAMATKRRLQFEDFARNFTLYSINVGPLMVPLFDSASIRTKEVELEYSTILSLVTAIDLSMNNLCGDIPKELTSLVELRFINLSGNHLTGSIPESIGAMKQLESLDLSKNSLSGQIPNGFTLLSSLSHLNLSFNKLSGRIPEGTQLGSLEASSFIGNDLCGPPLTRNCSHDGDEVHPKKEESEGEKAEIEWLYVFISSGFAVGFSTVCTALVLNKSWRYAYFRLLEYMWDNLYVYFYIKWKRLTRPTAPTSPT